MRLPAGFTLLEVVVAGGVLAFGIFALLTLQVQALQVQRNLLSIRSLVAAAEGELNLRLAVPPSYPVEGEEQDCAHGGDRPGVSSTCVVISEACQEPSAPYCWATTPPVRIAVRVEGPDGRSYALEALHAHFPQP